MAAAAETRTRIADPDCPIGRLNLEWARLCANVKVERRITAWAETESSLAGVGSLPALDRALDACTGDDSDALLLALLRLHAAGDELAGRVLLQRMLPQAVRVARSQLRHLGWKDACATAVCLLWEVIVTYPVQRRQRHVAANIALTTLRQAHRHGRRAARAAEGAHLMWALPVEALAEAEVVSPWRTSADQEAAALIDAAIAATVITADDAQLLRRVYLPAADGRPAAPREVAAEMGISWDALRQRCSRSMRALSAAGSAGVLSTAA